jgi:hypothetical protein
MCCRCPVKTFFKQDEIVTSLEIIIPANSDLIKSMMDFSFGTVVTIQCRLGFKQKNCYLSLIAEEVNEVNDVKVVVD